MTKNILLFTPEFVIVFSILVTIWFTFIIKNYL